MGGFSDFSVSTYRHTPSPEEIKKSIPFERFMDLKKEKIKMRRTYGSSHFLFKLGKKFKKVFVVRIVQMERSPISTVYFRTLKAQRIPSVAALIIPPA